MYKLSNPRKSCRSGLSSLNVNKIPLQGSRLLTPCICPKEVVFSPIFAVPSTWNNLPQLASFASGSSPNWNIFLIGLYSLIFRLNSVGPGSHSLVPCSSSLSQDWALYVSFPVYQEDGMYCSKAHPQHPSQGLAPRRYLTNCFYWFCSIISLES